MYTGHSSDAQLAHMRLVRGLRQLRRLQPVQRQGRLQR